MRQLSRKSSATAIAALMTIGLAACAAEPTTPSDPVSSATPSASPEGRVAPASYWDLACADLVDPADLAMFGVNPEPVDAAGSAPTARIPSAYVIRTVGGLSCEWSDGVEVGAVTGNWLQVEAIPHAADEWAHPWHAPEEGASCNDYRCTSELLSSEGEWVAVRSSAAGRDTAGFVQLVESVTGRLSEARGGGVTVATQTFAETCAEIADIGAIRSELGIETALAFAGGAGGWSIVSAAQSLAGLPGIPSCSLVATEDPTAAFGSVAWLQDAEWAFADWDAEDRAPVEVIGADDNTGFIVCDASEMECDVSFLLGDVWIIASACDLAQVNPNSSLQPAALTVRDAAVAIAELVAA
jgi:hypothetical protein